MSPAQVKSDFVNVRLADAGRDFAGPKGTVRIANAHMDYKFTGDVPQRVMTSEWTKVFSREMREGKPMFEIVPAVAPVAPVAPPAAVVPAAAKAAPILSQSAAQPVVESTQEK